MSKTQSAAQLAGRQRIADRAAARRDSAVAAVDDRREAGRVAGMQAVTAMREVLAAMRAETAGDPVAAAVATTWLLHGVVGAGPRTESDSLAAAGNADRSAAVRAVLADPALGLDLAAVGLLLGVDESRVRGIAGTARPRKAAESVTAA